MYKIMIIEDDKVISSSLKKHLEKWSYEVQCVEYFNQVMDEFLSFAPD